MLQVSEEIVKRMTGKASGVSSKCFSMTRDFEFAHECTTNDQLIDDDLLDSLNLTVGTDLLLYPQAPSGGGRVLGEVGSPDPSQRLA